MAKSLSSILSQIERLQKEAAAIQTEVVVRIRKDIEKYGLTAEQLFGGTSPAKRGGAKTAAVKPAQSTKVAKARKATETPKPRSTPMARATPGAAWASARTGCARRWQRASRWRSF